VLTSACQFGEAVQGGTPMTAQCESAALPPSNRPEVRRSRLAAFILEANIPAGGIRHFNPSNGRGLQ